MDFIRTLAARSTDQSLMLDVGANVGGYTNTMLEHKGIIHAFEPCPALAAGMKERFKNEPRVLVYQYGVSNRIYREDNLTVYEAWTLGKAGEPNKRGTSLGALEMVGNTPFAVDFITIDAHLANRMVCRLASVDFMKVDTDGHDYRVLQGALETIRQFRPNILIELGYLVEDVGDSNTEMLWFIFHILKYRIYDQEGRECKLEDAPRWFPHNTTRDYAMVPAERELVMV